MIPPRIWKNFTVCLTHRRAIADELDSGRGKVRAIQTGNTWQRECGFYYRGGL